jgi:hypothetical protein
LFRGGSDVREQAESDCFGRSGKNASGQRTMLKLLEKRADLFGVAETVC